MSDLRELARPFPDNYVHTNPSGGGSYVKHHVVVQRLLQIVGHYDFELVQIVRGDVAAIPPNPNASSKRGKEGAPALTNSVVGAVCRLTVTYDGETSRIEDVGDCEEPHNWKTDGARLKDAMSDAIKRCAARIGLGLHLWSQDEYFLPDELDRTSGTEGKPDPEPAAISDDQLQEISRLLGFVDAKAAVAEILSRSHTDSLDALSRDDAANAIAWLKQAEKAAS